jgi:outer membrane protein OmpA-like peptidoglycan-associated protein
MRRFLVLSLLLAVGACAAPSPPLQRFVVYYQEWSAALDAPAQQVVASAATWAKAHPTMRVSVAGYADPDGSPQANRDISRARAQNVTDEMVSDGVARERITITANGATEFVMDPLESRRVTISFSGI